MIFGRAMAARELGTTEKKIRTALELLKEVEFLAIRAASKYSVITIINWDSYQDEGPAKGQQEGQQRASKGPAKGPTKGHKQECKEEEYIYTPPPRARVDAPAPPNQAPTRGDAARLFKTARDVFTEIWPEAAPTAIIHTDNMLTDLADHLAADPQRAGPDFWDATARRARASAFLRREKPGRDGNFFSGMKFGWFIKPNTIGKILNGDFDDAPEPRSRDAPPQIDPEDYDPVKSF